MLIAFIFKVDGLLRYALLSDCRSNFRKYRISVLLLTSHSRQQGFNLIFNALRGGPRLGL